MVFARLPLITALIVLFNVRFTFAQVPSLLGTLDLPNLPQFLSNNPLPGGFPWGNQPGGSDRAPFTGVVRRYDFTISRATVAPDGFSKPSLLVNGQFPGPLIEANWGDTIEVTVHNQITGPAEGTTIHWHGQLQRGTPEMDGIPSVSQCPIAPGSSFTYRFQAQNFGTGWYHSHFGGQLLDGLFGPMITYGPSHVPYDKDLGPIIIQDYYHTPSSKLIQNIMDTNQTLQVNPTDNTLINGKMPFNCSASTGSNCQPNAPFSKFRVQAGKRYKLRLINAGAGSKLGFSIDNHALTIVANDFVAVQPYNVTFVQLGAGQRSDVIFTPKSNGSVWMRAQSLGKFCARSFNSAARAVVLVNDAPDTTIPKSVAATPPVDDGLCANDPLESTVPFFPAKPPTPSVTYDLTLNTIINETGHKLYTMNGSPFQGNYNQPVLFLADQKNSTFDPHWNVINFGKNSSIRINIWNNNSAPHPMHLHGHDMWVLHSGVGKWDGVSITNPSNPQRRDTHSLSPFGHMVLQYNADNPGVWPLHCHIAFHLSQGLFQTNMERPDEIANNQIPEVMKQTCRDWNAWTQGNIVDQIDSGV